MSTVSTRGKAFPNQTFGPAGPAISIVTGEVYHVGISPNLPVAPKKKRKGKAPRANRRVSQGNFVVPSPREVLSGRSMAGGWSAATLAEWGVPWPPPNGWRKFLRILYEQEGGVRHNTAFTEAYRNRWIGIITTPNCGYKLPISKVD